MSKIKFTKKSCVFFFGQTNIFDIANNIHFYDYSGSITISANIRTDNSFITFVHKIKKTKNILAHK